MQSLQLVKYFPLVAEWRLMCCKGQLLMIRCESNVTWPHLVCLFTSENRVKCAMHAYLHIVANMTTFIIPISNPDPVCSPNWVVLWTLLYLQTKSCVLTWKLSLSLLNSAEVYTLSAMIREMAWNSPGVTLWILSAGHGVWGHLFHILDPLCHLVVAHVVHILDEGVVLLPERHPDRWCLVSSL